MKLKIFLCQAPALNSRGNGEQTKEKEEGTISEQKIKMMREYIIH